ncbi:MAG TPA: hypothetical protein VGF21_08235 [Thermoleophilaceae bacterium]|jgi:hypothetical protein
MKATAGRVRVVVAATVAAMALGVLAAPSASAAGIKHWRFGIAHHLADSRSARITDGDFFSGRARFIDNFVSSSRQRFRNKKHGSRKRVYLIQGTLAIKNKRDYNVLGASCRTSVPKGAYMLLTVHGQRAFFPRPANHIKQRHSEGTIGLSLSHLSVSLPFPAFTYYESTSVGPNVAWSSLSSRVHNWTWGWDDSYPQNVLLGYTGYWAGSAKRIKYKMRCKVITVHDDFHFSSATVRMTRTVAH